LLITLTGRVKIHLILRKPELTPAAPGGCGGKANLGLAITRARLHGEKGSSHESSESPRSRVKAGILETEEPPAKVTYSVIPEKAGIQDSLNPAPSGTGFRFVLRLLGMTTSPVFESFA